MKHIVVKVVEPKMSPDSALSQPTEFWLAGTTYLHKKEALDKKRNKQKEAIVVSPDYWQIDLVSKTGTHVHEKKAKPVELPIFRTSSGSALVGLNFGNEIAFFEALRAKKVDPKTVATKGKSAEAVLTSNDQSAPKAMQVTTKKNADGVEITEYRLPLDTRLIVFEVDQKTHTPLSIRIRSEKSGKTMKMQYLTYETVPFNPAAFKPEPNLKVENFDGDTWRKKQDQTRQELAEIESKAANYRKQLLEKFIAERKNQGIK